jgi:hypothetical protein
VAGASLSRPKRGEMSRGSGGCDGQSHNRADDETRSRESQSACAARRVSPRGADVHNRCAHSSDFSFRKLASRLRSKSTIPCRAQPARSSAILRASVVHVRATRRNTSSRARTLRFSRSSFVIGSVMRLPITATTSARHLAPLRSRQRRARHRPQAPPSRSTGPAAQAVDRGRHCATPAPSRSIAGGAANRDVSAA